ncbi:altronate dehydratase [Clostridiales bacterium COT073_COT-073]|nr:altronate dehydratase [Clostridiales bacterium COT073_COT-073]
MNPFIKIHSQDKVAVALRELDADSKLTIDGQELILKEQIPQGHKFALCDIAENEQIIKYGAPIGLAKSNIYRGMWVHTHNMKTGLGEVLDYSYQPQPIKMKTIKDKHYFQGFQREDGKVGVRNEIWIIPTVGCINNIATMIERRAQSFVKGSIDAIAAFPHPYGCSQMGDDQENTRKILADLICHPNAGGVLVLGLGCENSNIDIMKEYIGNYDDRRIKFLATQQSDDEIEEGLRLVEEIADHVSQFKRQPIPCSELIIGLKCGGSDGLSGITANPTVGEFSDLLIAEGGTTILTEVPEMFGAETLLMNRCENEELFEKTVHLINDFKNYFISHDQTIYENPSPGNKKGGISSLEDKSLGCTQKSGSAPVRGVLEYGEPVKTRGLNLLSAPGNDLVASTALAASGAHIVLFTTGRGTPFASPVPTVKISSNTALYQRKQNWIDFDCGSIVNGESLEKLGLELFEYVRAVASGKKVKSEEAGFHDMAIFKQGVTL